MALLTHSFLTAKQLFPGFFTFFYAFFLFLRPEHDCYAKFTSCYIKTTLENKLSIKHLIKIINLGAKTALQEGMG